SVARLAHHIDQTGTDEALALPQVSPDPDHALAPFPLNPIQQAYWLGRQSGFELGQVAAQGYIEFDLDDIRQLDTSRLEHAWRGLIARHPMLRTVILSSGQQQVLDDVPAYSIAVTDLQALDDTTLATRLASIRHTESHRVSDPGTWPLFDCQLLQLPGQKGRLLLRIDALIMDAGSIFL
ncbi:condensation domain-containing protein, partial [Sansalvadorimonas verongulae]|uniref:condensation domain-containing protein n=1 Tax=Sansalvadorimonas verongulae TaxID=2172824 RepID=UPI001E54ECD4